MLPAISVASRPCIDDVDTEAIELIRNDDALHVRLCMKVMHARREVEKRRARG